MSVSSLKAKKGKHAPQEGARGSKTAPEATSSVSNLAKGKVSGNLEKISSEEDQGAGISVFLSYARKDEEMLQFLKPFKNLLSYFVSAKSGRDISAFVDTESIQWGDVWWEEIQKSVLSATVFIPIMSANYLKSDNCRKEFNIFHSTATNMGVSELVLPVMLQRAPAIFKSDSGDEIVQIVMDRQYEVIEEACMTEPGSSEWKSTMSKLANRFVAAYEKSEDKLAEARPRPAQRDATEDEDQDDLPGIADLLPVLEDQIKELTDAASELEPAMHTVGEETLTSNPPQGKNATPKQLQLWAIRAANALKEPAYEIENAGERLFAAVQQLDKSVDDLRRLSEDVTEFQEPYKQMVQAFGDLGDTRDELSKLLQSLKMAESLSAAVRRSLKPMRTGLVLVQDSISIMDGWQRK